MRKNLFQPEEWKIIEIINRHIPERQNDDFPFIDWVKIESGVEEETKKK